MTEILNFANLYRAADVRDELQTLRKRIKAQAAKHSRDADGPQLARLFTSEHRRTTCPDCIHFRGQIAGIEAALKLFGGRVNDSAQSQPMEENDDSATTAS